MGLQLLPGEKEELHLRPALSSTLARQAGGLALVPYAALLWAAFHSPWWTAHTPSDWTAAWTWLWGTPQAAYLWTVAGFAVAGIASCLPRGSWRRALVAIGLGAACALAAAIWKPDAPEDALPLATLVAALPVLAWNEAARWATHYHVTNLRLVVRTTFPRPTDSALLYSEMVDLDARPSAWPDTGTLIPVAARAAAASADAPAASPASPSVSASGPGATLSRQPPRLAGVRPFARVRRLVEVLAQRATASEYVRTQRKLDDDVAHALAALHRK